MPTIAASRKLQRTAQSRVFTIANRAGPANTPVYQALARALAPSWAQGDDTPVRIPNPDQYDSFIVIDRITGAQGLPTLSLEFRMTRDLSDVLALTRMGCPFDVQVHSGACRNPSDFNEGWLDGKIIVLEAAKITNYESNELGALDSDQNAVINETIALSGLDYYEIVSVGAAEVAAAEIVQRIVDVAICDSKTCGECGIASNGCQKVFAVTLSAGGSPGLPAEVIFSEDGGQTFGDTNVTTLAANEDPSAVGCVGTNLVVTSEDSESAHYAPIADILLGVETWVEVSTGFVSGKGPRNMFSISRTFTWIVGAGGYIYFTDDITAGVEVQTAGSVTVQDLNAIHGWDIFNLVAVGASNAVLVTDNGGQTWTAVVGPAVGVALNTVWMRSPSEWFVGAADGNLYYTRDSGSTWTTKPFPGSGTGSVNDISFSGNTVGYLAHTTTAPAGRVLRTIDGGHSWYVAPEGNLNMPDNDSIVALATCDEDKNLAYGGGLAANATDGFMVKVA